LAAGPAAVHQQIASQYGSSADLPCADFSLLVRLKRSPDYGAIRPRVADLKPIDAWQEDGFHFFVFQLRPVGIVEQSLPEAPVAVFVMHPESAAAISAVVVTPNPGGEHAQVTDLRNPGNVYTAPYEP
jgi:hypothetical protein